MTEQIEKYNPGVFLDQLRQKRPLVHCITNDVTVNDCANALLAAGASPVMATAPEEVKILAASADALYLNIGTLTSQTFDSMLMAAFAAKRAKKMVVLDPVGAGATGFRTESARRILETGAVTLLRGNTSEIRAIAGVSSGTRGVDAGEEDLLCLEENEKIAQKLARRYFITVGISGPVDIIADEKQTAFVRNGREMMTAICGTGCMLSAICAAFLGASPNTVFPAALSAFTLTGLAGEWAIDSLKTDEGPAAGRIRFIDALYKITPEKLKKNARYEIR